ncbi:hypothetical protein BD410DRAFT_99752 [Rickenella mellea]|uniref:Uncharacterized protein n=1 Tax=Rickenella mellea TaxID=50990 RepID=A0A4Y7PM67_9AGAM|nr:hypothetical protein BD410DRAFT_99752 [Rickenella mellea]
MSEHGNHSPTPTFSSVHSGASLRRIGGEQYAQGGSDETLSETIGSTRPQVLDEFPKNEPAPHASETHSLISPTSSTLGTGSHHGADEKWKRSTMLMLMLYTAIGTLFALAHHFLYEALSHHPTLAVSIQIGPFKIGPTWALTLGNGLAWLVQLFYTLAIGGALVQLFWHLLHTRHFTLREMDRVFSITSAFYTRTALRRATGLAIVAVISMGIGGVVSTFAPPSLAISVLPLSQPCDIMTVDFTLASVSSTTNALSNLVTHVLLTQSIMPPASSPCSNCTYNVTYFAPGLACEEIDMAASPFNPDPDDHVVLWNGTTELGLTGVIHILSRTGNATGIYTGVFSSPQIITCSLQNASYHVTIDHRNGTSVTAEVDIVPFLSDTDPGQQANITFAYIGIGQAFEEFMSGSVELVQNRDITLGDDYLSYIINKNSFVAYTGWITCDPGVHGNCTRNIDLLTSLPILMQYLGASLLAGSVTIDNTTSSLSRVPDGHCLNESLVYVYNRVRLLAVYGSALFVTSICVAFGIHSVMAGEGSNLKFSNLVYAILTPEMIEISNGQELPEDTVIHAVRGRFVPG